jgi:hypothetical protein
VRDGIIMARRLKAVSCERASQTRNQTPVETILSADSI